MGGLFAKQLLHSHRVNVVNILIIYCRNPTKTIHLTFSGLGTMTGRDHRACLPVLTAPYLIQLLTVVATIVEYVV
jgi:hypothetical protein